MLGDGYLTFNSVAIPNPTNMSIQFDNLENVVESEAGTELAVVTRLQKRTFSCGCKCTSTWLSKFRTMCALSSGTLVYLNESIVCRARIEYVSLVNNSEYADRTDGLWEVTLSFTEV